MATEQALRVAPDSLLEAYVQDVVASKALGLWRLDSQARGVLGPASKARRFEGVDRLGLEGADFGGAEVTVELWANAASGTLLSYGDPTQTPVFEISAEDHLQVAVAGARVDTGVSLNDGEWQHIGVAWRGVDGLMLVGLDGHEVWRGKVATGISLPYDGVLALGPLTGTLDEVAVFDHFKYPSQWLRRVKVVEGTRAPTPLPSSIPIHAEVQVGHAHFTAVSWSPDGEHFASASINGTIKVWDASTGVLLRTLEGHIRGVASIAWSPDGDTIASGGFDATVKTWDARSGALLHTLEGHLGYVTSVAWSPDGERIASVGSSLKVWEASSGTLLHTFGEPGENAVAWSPDGERLVSGSDDRKARVKVWDPLSGQLIRSFHDDAFDGDVIAVDWSPDGAFIVSGGADHRINSRRGIVTVWDAHSGDPQRTFEQPYHVGRVEYSPTGLQVLVSANDNNVTVIDAGTGAPVHTYKSTNKATWSPDGTSILSCMDDQADVWSAANGHHLRTITRPDHSVNSVRWSPDQGLVAASTGDGAVQVWDTRRGEHVRTHGAYSNYSTVISWGPHGQLLSGDRDGSVRIGEDQLRAVPGDDGPQRHTSWITSLSWRPDGLRFASGSRDRTVKVWDASSGIVLRTLESPGVVTSVSWSPDGERLASASSVDADIGAGVVTLWNPELGRKLREFRTNTGPANSVEWSPDGARIALASGDGTIQMLDVATGEVSHVDHRHSDSATSVAWSPDGARVASGGSDAIIKVFDAKTRQALQSLEGHSGSITSIHWSSDAKKLASGSKDGTLRIWDVEVGTAVMLTGDEAGWALMTDDGYFDGSRHAPFALVRGLQGFDIEQLAPARNRADKVLAALGGDPQRIDIYEVLWRRRIQRLDLDPTKVAADFTSAPTVRVAPVEQPDPAGKARIQAIFEDQVGLASYRVYVNGVATTLDPVPIEGQRERAQFTVQLTRGVNRIEVATLNVQGIESLRASMTMMASGEALPKPRLFYVGFGVSDYEDDRIDLRYAHQDALDLGYALASSMSEYAEVRTLTLVDAQVTQHAIGETRTFLDDVTEHDTLVMFIAGHGARGDDRERTYYYLDHDARFQDLANTAIPFEELEALLYEARARKKMLLLDTCESGDDVDWGALASAIPGVDDLRGRSIPRGLVYALDSTVTMDLDLWRDVTAADRLINRDLVRHSGAIVLASAMGRESALESSVWGNGAFTEVLLRGLTTRAADLNYDKMIDSSEIERHVVAEVPRLTHGRQHPNIERGNPLQAFALVKAP